MPLPWVARLPKSATRRSSASALIPGRETSASWRMRWPGRWQCLSGRFCCQGTCRRWCRESRSPPAPNPLTTIGLHWESCSDGTSLECWSARPETRRQRRLFSGSIAEPCRGRNRKAIANLSNEAQLPPLAPSLQLKTVPRRWPVLVALGLVTLLLLAMIGADLIVAGNVAERTAEIVDDEQRSIELVDDLREQAARLASPSLHQAELLQVIQRIEEDARAYDPLTVQPGEREEWNRLRHSLEELQARAQAGGGVELERHVGEIGKSIDRLVQINREAAHQQAADIRQLHRGAILVDGAIGLLTLGLVATIVFVLLRVLKRQRSLLESHIALLGERNRELDAFAGRAAHDLRIPLNPIRGYADLLLTGDESPQEVQAMAARIRIAVDRMSRIIDDML